MLRPLVPGDPRRLPLCSSSCCWCASTSGARSRWPARAHHLASPAVRAVLAEWMILGYGVAGAVAWWRRPESRLGPLMLAAGGAASIAKLSWANDAVVSTVGELLDFLQPVLFIACLPRVSDWPAPDGAGACVRRGGVCGGARAAARAPPPRRRGAAERARRRVAADCGDRRPGHAAVQHGGTRAGGDRRPRPAPAGRRAAASPLVRPPDRVVRARTGRDRDALPLDRARRARGRDDPPRHLRP